jgi:hypothetical protein
LRSGALQSRRRTDGGIRYDPGSAQQREEHCSASGKRKFRSVRVLPRHKIGLAYLGWEETMDNDKSITKKLTAVISKAADTVKHAVSHVVESASDAAQHAMETNAQKISRIPPAAVPGQVAATTNEQVYLPEAADAAAMPAPLVAAQPAPKKRKPAAKPRPASKAAAKARATRTSRTRTSGKKTGKPAKRVAKKPVPRKTAKAAAKAPRRASKTARRKSGK